MITRCSAASVKQEGFEALGWCEPCDCPDLCSLTSTWKFGKARKAVVILYAVIPRTVAVRGVRKRVRAINLSAELRHITKQLGVVACFFRLASSWRTSSSKYNISLQRLFCVPLTGHGRSSLSSGFKSCMALLTKLGEVWFHASGTAALSNWSLSLHLTWRIWSAVATTAAV